MAPEAEEQKTAESWISSDWIKAWLPVLIGVALIATSSSNLFSAQHTNGPFRWLYETLFGPVGDDRWGQVHLYMRKGGHFFGYGVFGLLWLRAWRITLPQYRFLLDSLLAVLGCAIVASADEFHQTFLSNRTGTPWDVLLDCTGAATLQLIVYIFLRIFRPRQLEIPA